MTWRSYQIVTSKKFGSGLPPSLSAEVSPNLAEFTQGVSYPGAQTLKSPASAIPPPALNFAGNITIISRDSQGRGEEEWIEDSRWMIEGK
jgi:hypothetical protein